MVNFVRIVGFLLTNLSWDSGKSVLPDLGKERGGGTFVLTFRTFIVFSVGFLFRLSFSFHLMNPWVLTSLLYRRVEYWCGGKLSSSTGSHKGLGVGSLSPVVS